MKDTITVVVPVYNEEGAVGETIEKLKGVLSGSGAQYDIIVVDDGSRDRTPEILSKIDGIHVITHPTNRGYGTALKTGIRRAKGDWILITDADGSYSPDNVPRLLEQTEGCDMVVGLRRGDRRHDSFVRVPAKWFLNKLASYLAGVTIPDLNSGMRVFRRELTREFWHLFPARFSFTATLTMCLLSGGYIVKYVKKDYLKRIGRSKIVPSHLAQFVNLVIRLTVYYEPLRIVIPISLTVLAAALFFAVYSHFYLHKIMDVTVVVLALSALHIFLFGLLAEVVVKRSAR